MTRGRTTNAPRRPAFASAADERAFEQAYDDALALWDGPVEALDVETAHGRTRVHACGPPDGPPVVLLHGGGATSTAWAAVAPALARAGHRVLAPDQVGDAGRSVHDGPRLRSHADLTTWLGDVLDGLGTGPAVVVGHSYGAWLAVRYALARPGRVARLVLLDPSDVLVGLRAAYRARAVPVLLAPSPARTRGLLAWETQGAPLPPAWLHLAGLAATARTSRVVLPRRPSTAELAGLGVPVLQLLAARSRAVDPDAALERAARRLPGSRSDVLPDATHHTLPLLDGDAVVRAVTSPGTVVP